MSKEFDYKLLDSMKEESNNTKKHFYISTFG